MCVPRGAATAALVQRLDQFAAAGERDQEPGCERVAGSRHFLQGAVRRLRVCLLPVEHADGAPRAARDTGEAVALAEHAGRAVGVLAPVNARACCSFATTAFPPSGSASSAAASRSTHSARARLRAASSARLGR